MKKTTVAIIAGSIVAVVAVVITVVVVAGGNDSAGVGQSSKSATGVTADESGTPKKIMATPAMKRKMRPSRMFNGRRLPEMPMPSAQKRHDMPPQPGDGKGSPTCDSNSAGGTAGFDQNQNRGGQSVQNVVNRARSLRSAGQEAEANKLLRNALMIESNPYSRKILMQEMKLTPKTVDPAVPATGSVPASKPATMPVPAPASTR